MYVKKIQTINTLESKYYNVCKSLCIKQIYYDFTADKFLLLILRDENIFEVYDAETLTCIVSYNLKENDIAMGFSKMVKAINSKQNIITLHIIMPVVNKLIRIPYTIKLANFLTHVKFEMLGVTTVLILNNSVTIFNDVLQTSKHFVKICNKFFFWYYTTNQKYQPIDMLVQPFTQAPILQGYNLCLNPTKYLYKALI